MKNHNYELLTNNQYCYLLVKGYTTATQNLNLVLDRIVLLPFQSLIGIRVDFNLVLV